MVMAVFALSATVRAEAAPPPAPQAEVGSR
jgi:hypothetical protein